MRFLAFLRDRAYILLRWSERYTKTDMVYLARGSFWLGLSQTVSAATSLLLALAFANLLPQDVYGEYRYVLSVVGILTMATLTGMNIAVSQSVARGFEGSFKEVFRTRVRWGLLGAVASLITAAYYFHAGNMALVVPFLIGAVFLPLMDPLTLYAAFLQGKKLFKEASLYESLTQITTTVVFVIVLFCTDNLAIVILVYFLSWTTVRFFLHRWVFRRHAPNDQVDPGTIPFGTHLSIMGFMSGIASYLDKFLVFHYVGAVDLAIYTIALAPVEQMKSLFKNIPSLALPIFSKRTLPEIDRMLYQRLLQLLLLGGLCATAYVLIAPYVFPLLFPKYLASVHYSQWYAVSIVFLPALIFISTAFQSKPALLKTTYISGLAANVFLITGMLVLGYYFGVIGIIATRVLQYLFNLLFGVFLWERTKLPSPT